MTVEKLHPGLAISALVLGIVSLVFSLFVVGALFGLVGLILGGVYLRRHRSEPRGMAISGIVLSGVGVLASAGMGAVYYMMISTVINASSSSANLSTIMAWQGVAAPDFTVTTLDGEVIELEALRGRRVVVDFWATWCGPCIRDIPHFNQLASENPADELVVIGISKEPHGVIAPFVEEHAVIFPMASARDLPEPYSLVGAIPTTFYIDRNGIIQSVTVGARGFEALEARALDDDYDGEARSAPVAVPEA